MTDAPTSPNASPSAPAIAPAELAFSCRLPLLVMFLSAAIWLVIASAFALIASIKFHSPNFLADCPWLTYGRVWPAYTNSVLYGCCLQAGLGTILWVFTHLGLTTLAQRGLVTLSASFWNLGVTIGVLGILGGDSTGFQNLEMPSYATLFLFLSYLLIGFWAVITFHQRRQRALFVSQWYLFAALFWFAWIYSTAQLLLVTFPVRGVTQSVIDWWYSDNLQVVWLGLVGLGAIFYFVPKLTGRPLYSHYLALFTFWMLILFGSWGGIPNTAPVPAWMPALSATSTVLTLLPLVAVALNVHWTLAGDFSKLSAFPALRFIVFGAAAFLLAGLMKIGGVLLDTNQLLHFTWFARAREQLYIYGFFAMVMFGTIYRVLPQLTGTELPWPKLMRAHFWLAAAGIVLVFLPLTIGGIVETFKLANPAIDFVTISKSTLPFLRVSTLGDLLIAAGHVLFAANLIELAHRFYKAKMAAAYALATADLFKTAEVKP
ncbi:MAG TPA: cbb3-type cytochrome c oxidase subunit I [Candidatus Binatia bacterium]|nr:cbb3-type cytochrome c oxidase subunit I [Candidatus Binatia bacterium]